MGPEHRQRVECFARARGMGERRGSVPHGQFRWGGKYGEEASGKLPFPVHALTVGGDHMAVYWDGGTGKQLAVLEGHLDELTNVAVVGRGRFTVTSSLDGTARIWDLAASQ